MDILSTIDSLAKMTTVALMLWREKTPSWSEKIKKKYEDEFNSIIKRLDHEQRKSINDKGISGQDFNLVDHLNRDLIMFTRRLHSDITASRTKDTKVQ